MIRLQNTWRCDDQFILHQINDSLPAAGFVRSSRAEWSRTENIRWLLFRDVLQLSYMLMNLYERLNQKCLSSRNFGHKNRERCHVESVLTEYLMSRLITQASGYQADPDHAAQLSHHGESFSFIHPQVTTGYLHQAGAEWWWWVRSWDMKDENDSGSEGLNRSVENDVIECSSVSFFPQTEEIQFTVRRNKPECVHISLRSRDQRIITKDSND